MTRPRLMPSDTEAAMRDMDVAIETVTRSRLAASKYRQLGFLAFSEWHRDNANCAEKWLIRAGKLYPHRCAA